MKRKPHKLPTVDFITFHYALQKSGKWKKVVKRHKPRKEITDQELADQLADNFGCVITRKMWLAVARRAKQLLLKP
jgi:hypothetical protein